MQHPKTVFKRFDVNAKRNANSQTPDVEGLFNHTAKWKLIGEKGKMQSPSTSIDFYTMTAILVARFNKPTF